MQGGIHLAKVVLTLLNNNGGGEGKKTEGRMKEQSVREERASGGWRRATSGLCGCRCPSITRHVRRREDGRARMTTVSERS